MGKTEKDWSEVINNLIKNPPLHKETQIEDQSHILDGEREEIVLKVVLIGDGGVGKTSIRERYMGRAFSTRYLATIGADFASKKEEIDNKVIRFQIWDLAGQPRFQVVRNMYYSGARAAIVVCDISKPESVSNINNWINELWKNNGQGPIPFIILGNKIDLRELEMNCISDQVLVEAALGISSMTSKDFGFSIDFLPTSAKTGQNISDAFKQLVIQVLSHQRYLEKLS